MGRLAVAFAFFAELAENLIEAMNILGSIFYGVLPGRFWRRSSFAAWAGRRCASRPSPRALVIVMYFSLNIGYLWYNVIGCAACIAFSVACRRLLARVGREDELLCHER